MSGSSHQYDGTPQVEASQVDGDIGGMIWVTVDYRLNVFGFLGSEALRSRDDKGSTGNYGLQDQRLGELFFFHPACTLHLAEWLLVASSNQVSLKRPRFIQCTRALDLIELNVWCQCFSRGSTAVGLREYSRVRRRQQQDHDRRLQRRRGLHCKPRCERRELALLFQGKRQQRHVRDVEHNVDG